MNSDTISEFADWIYKNCKDVENKSTKLDTKKVYDLINNLEILRKPIQDYFDMTEEEYYQNESDHRLTLQNPTGTLGQLHDRVQVNHVDGSLSGHEINFTYNHEDPYADGDYKAKIDLHLIEYAFTVIGAVYDNTIVSDVRNALSNDAVLSIGLAAKAIEEWQ